MQNKKVAHLVRTSAAGLACAAAISLTGCGAGTFAGSPAAPIVAASALQGSVHGGQQPVGGASLQLYAASTGGYASTSYALLNTAVASDASGNFSITGDYTCPSASSQTYIVATGGNPGAGTNPNLAMMAALGPCGNLSPSSFIIINEVSTVASVFALAPFMSTYTSIGSSATNATGLGYAFASAGKLANVATGTSPGPLPAGATVPVAKIYTIADILAACVNTTGGTAGDNTACGTLFTATTPSGGAAPKDTIAAALNIARFPGSNVATLTSLAPPTSPFQPTMTSTSDFTLAIKYTAGGFSSPSASAIDPSGQLWVTNAGGNSVSVLSASGAPAAAVALTGSGLSAPSGVAIDSAGNAWVSNKGNSTLTVFTPSFTGSQPTVAGLAAPSAVAIDGQGLVWVTNSGSNSVTAVVASGTTASSATTYATAGVSAPVAVAINPR